MQQDSATEWQRKVAALEASLEEKTVREKQLMGDLKKKGDTARQMLLAKDEELGVLRDRLRAAVEAATQLQLAAASAAPAAAPKPTGASTAGEHSAVGSNSGEAHTHTGHKDKLLTRTPSDRTIFTVEEVLMLVGCVFTYLRS